ncbi:MAG TPA: LytTR family DNA-binding domain-containing protein [Longimicrobium sp.]
MIRALLVDDEPLARRGLHQLLAPHADVEIVGECGDGRSALDAIRALRPDLLFLDVQMPELDGFAVMRALGADAPPAVVFLTAYGEFALEAFDVEAVDYLVKPVREERFEEALRRARRRLPAADHFLVPGARGQVVIRVDEVEWIEADDYYARIHAHGRSYLLREALASIEERLAGTRLVRVHRGALVHLDRIRRIGTADVTLVSGTVIPVSRRRRGWLLERVRGR